jgi:predicted DNA-binding protein YlxM (UPF0122 family)
MYFKTKFRELIGTNELPWYCIILTPRQREIFFHFYCMNMSRNEVAKKYNISPKTVDATIMNCTKKIRLFLKEKNANVTI